MTTPTAATIGRLPSYLRALDLRDPVSWVSSSDLAEASGFTRETVRRDLWSVGARGTRGAGWKASSLRATLQSRVGHHGRQSRLAICGAGRLGRALASYPSLAASGFELVAVFDQDPEVVGSAAGRVSVTHVAQMVQVCRQTGTALGVITTPVGAAQAAAEAFVEAGVSAILNFAPTLIEVHVPVRNVDLLRELHVLAFMADQATSQ